MPTDRMGKLIIFLPLLVLGLVLFFAASAWFHRMVELRRDLSTLQRDVNQLRDDLDRLEVGLSK